MLPGTRSMQVTKRGERRREGGKEYLRDLSISKGR